MGMAIDMLRMRKTAAGGGGGPTPLPGFYYSQSYVEVSSGTMPSNVSAPVVVRSVTVPASGSARTFLVSGLISAIQNGVSEIVGGVTLDGAFYVPKLRTSRGPPGAAAVVIEGLIVTVPGDGNPHTIGVGYVAESNTSAVTLNGSMIRAIDLSYVTAYHSSTITPASSGTINPALVAFQSCTIPASGSARTFLVSGMIGHTGSGGRIRSAIMLDGAAVSNNQVNPHWDTSNADLHNGLCGIIVTVPGDGASHTISIGGAAQASTSATTIQFKSVCAIDLSSVTAHHAESYANTSSGTLPTSSVPLYDLVIPGSGTERVFSVDALLSWGDVSNGVVGSIHLDGVAVYPANVSLHDKNLAPATNGDGQTTLRFAGVQITIPGDGASHTLSIGGWAYTTTTAVTWSNRAIAAVQVA